MCQQIGIGLEGNHLKPFFKIVIRVFTHVHAHVIHQILNFFWLVHVVLIWLLSSGLTESLMPQTNSLTSEVLKSREFSISVASSILINSSCTSMATRRTFVRRNSRKRESLNNLASAPSMSTFKKSTSSNPVFSSSSQISMASTYWQCCCLSPPGC